MNGFDFLFYDLANDDNTTGLFPENEKPKTKVGKNQGHIKNKVIANDKEKIEDEDITNSDDDDTEDDVIDYDDIDELEDMEDNDFDDDGDDDF